MKILYFTATGNNLYLAKRLGGELISIPQAIKEQKYIFSDDKIGIIFPIYYLSVPPYILKFLKKLELKSSYIFAIMSYGMFDGATTTHLMEAGSHYGINFSYINTIKMVDNWIPNFNMNDQKRTEPKKQIEKHLDNIISDINQSKQWIKKDSFFDKLITKQMIKVHKKDNKNKTSGSNDIRQGIDRRFSVEDSCTKCGICAKVCPVDNITVNLAKPEFKDRCISCLACTQNCPQNAIRLEGEKDKARFRNQHINLDEIIKANK